MLCQKSIELIGEGMSVFLSEGLRSAGHFAAFPDAFHQVAHGEVLFDIFDAVEFPSVIDGVGVLCNDPIGQWDVGGDDQITGLAECDDTVIGFIGSLIDDDGLNVLGFADGDLLVGDDDCRDGEAFDAAQDDRFEKIGEGIPIDEEGHMISLTRPTSRVSRRTLMPCGWCGDLVRIC